MREPFAQGTVVAGTNPVRNRVNDSDCRKHVHTDHISRHLSDDNTRHNVVSTGSLVEKLRQQSVPSHRGHADGTIGEQEVPARVGGDAIHRIPTSLGALRFYFSHSSHQSFRLFLFFTPRLLGHPYLFNPQSRDETCRYKIHCNNPHHNVFPTKNDWTAVATRNGGSL